MARYCFRSTRTSRNCSISRGRFLPSRRDRSNADEPNRFACFGRNGPRGCHGQNLAGGPIAGGDPRWPPARNVTPHADGLAGWTFEQFTTSLREGTRPDGTLLRVPMTIVAPYARNMTDIELQALWMYLQSVPPVASTM